MARINSALLCLALLLLFSDCRASRPLVINTWAFKEAAENAWKTLSSGKSGLDALVNGLKTCQELQCEGTVGFGGSPDENGETTLDALIFDGVAMDVGAVGALRSVKDAAGVARMVLQRTEHSFLVGDQATEFAKAMGFEVESLTTNKSRQIHEDWRKNNCQPNFWKNVKPNPQLSCGPYKPLLANDVTYDYERDNTVWPTMNNHDTIAMVVLDGKKSVVAGTSTNGAKHKIPGRVGDSPIPGAGAYADAEVGAAGCTGDGDIMMRFLPSYAAVEELRRGATPLAAANTAMEKIARKFPKFFGAIVVANKAGDYGAACNGFDQFHYSVVSKETRNKTVVQSVECENQPPKDAEKVLSNNWLALRK